MKKTSLTELLKEIFPELLNKLVGLGKITINLTWNGQEFSAEIVNTSDQES